VSGGTAAAQGDAIETWNIWSSNDFQVKTYDQAMSLQSPQRNLFGLFSGTRNAKTNWRSLLTFLTTANDKLQAKRDHDFCKGPFIWRFLIFAFAHESLPVSLPHISPAYRSRGFLYMPKAGLCRLYSGVWLVCVFEYF
jgi:hypothetical protein